jgi:hypothetical protein
VVLLAVVASVLLPDAALADRNPRDCKPYVFLGARGSGEPSPLNSPGRPDVGRFGLAGVGNTLAPEYRKLIELLNDPQRKIVEARYVPYEAFGALNWKPFKSDLFGLVIGRDLVSAGAGVIASRAVRYHQSVSEGTDRLVDELENLARFCPRSTRIVLAGYSQGAHVVGNALQRAGRQVRERVLGVSLFGDPLFNPLASAAGDFDTSRNGLLGSRGRYPPDLRDRIQSWCYAGDWICQGVEDFTAVLAAKNTHASYGSSAAILEALRIFQLIRHNEAGKGGTVPGAPSPASRPVDVSFVVDSTGSMFSAIESVKDNLQLVRDRLAARATSLTTALVDYKDEPVEESDYQSRLVSPLTEDAASFAQAVDGLEAKGGGDYPESVFAGISTGLSVSWRPGAAKILLLVGDAPPKDPEPLTGLTERAITDSALRVPASIYTLTVGDDETTRESFSRLASSTSGQTYDVEDPSAAVASILAAIDFHASVPTASIGTSGSGAHASRLSRDAGVGEPLRFSTASSESPLGEALTFTWDFGDGTVLSTRNRVVTHAWGAPFSGDVRVTVSDESGRSAQALRSVRIEGKGLAKPSRLDPPRVRIAGRTALVSWKAPVRGRASYYELLSNRRLVGAIDAPAKRKARIRLRVQGLGTGKEVRFTVRAVDRLGRGVTSRPSRAVTLKRKR